MEEMILNDLEDKDLRRILENLAKAGLFIERCSSFCKTEKEFKEFTNLIRMPIQDCIQIMVNPKTFK